MPQSPKASKQLVKALVLGALVWQYFTCRRSASISVPSPKRSSGFDRDRSPPAIVTTPFSTLYSRSYNYRTSQVSDALTAVSAVVGGATAAASSPADENAEARGSRQRFECEWGSSSSSSLSWSTGESSEDEDSDSSDSSSSSSSDSARPSKRPQRQGKHKKDETKVERASSSDRKEAGKKDDVDEYEEEEEEEEAAARRTVVEVQAGTCTGKEGARGMGGRLLRGE